MNFFTWDTEGSVKLPPFDFIVVGRWLEDVAKCNGKIIGDINYIFCDDETILHVNIEYLQHDYYTDIITFDRSLRGILRGDIYISLNTVESNAEKYNQNYFTELKRVIVHGLLHLCGINDKGPGEREIMEMKENEALELLNKSGYVF